MKRFHIHVSVENLDRSIQFYSTLFGATPARVEADYAKWMLEDPRVNFAISTHRQPVGVNHSGSRWTPMRSCGVCTRSWRQPIHSLFRRPSRRAATRGEQVLGDGSDRHRLGDFHTLDSIRVYGTDTPYSTTANPSFPLSALREVAVLRSGCEVSSHRRWCYVLWP